MTDVLIPSYDIERSAPFFFRSAKAKLDAVYDFAMKDVARAASAAPTYFNPVKLSGQGDDYYALIDGGIYANNPSMCALVEARRRYPDADTFLFVSLGCGHQPEPLPYDNAKRWGLAQWAKPLLHMVFDGVSSTVDYQVHQLLEGDSSGCKRYFRFQPQLDDKSTSLDNATPRNLRRLRIIAEKLMYEREDDLKALARLLVDGCPHQPSNFSAALATSSTCGRISSSRSGL